jgi:hypothetical protein
MPLAAPINSGLGIRNPYNILTIVERGRADSRRCRRQYRVGRRHRDGARL